MSAKTIGGIAAALAVAVVAVVVLVGGADEQDQGTETDGAFVTEMVPHHEGAIEMAEIAQQRAEHPEIATLANEIIDSQSTEIEQLDAIHQRIFGEPVGAVEHGSLGLADHEMGMSMDTASLETAKSFDREFVDMMIPHHQGAIVMARVELAEGQDEEAQALAEQIIAAQTSEIEEMNSWRAEWYGSESPAGGVPAEDESAPSHEDMGH